MSDPITTVLAPLGNLLPGSSSTVASAAEGVIAQAIPGASVVSALLPTAGATASTLKASAVIQDLGVLLGTTAQIPSLASLATFLGALGL
jgi:hypothetical protein